jgi:hypothetical protein
VSNAIRERPELLTYRAERLVFFGLGPTFHVALPPLPLPYTIG